MRPHLRHATSRGFSLESQARQRTRIRGEQTRRIGFDPATEKRIQEGLASINLPE
jgi:hypothetical protein